MTDCKRFYISGAWVSANDREMVDIIDLASEQSVRKVSIGTAEDADAAVRAAAAVFHQWSRSSRAERLALFDRIITAYTARMEDLATAVCEELGAPGWLARNAQVPTGLAHFKIARDVLADYVFEEAHGRTVVVREPVGVCALITPWNWPLNQMACKIAPALAVGCTIVLKPSELTPSCAVILAEILHEAGVPAGVFNLVHGDGPGVGTSLSTHPLVDMVSFTGSTGAGIQVAKAAADTVKRVHQELGGKSPFVVLPDADLRAALSAALSGVFLNSGQSCNAPTRLLLPVDRLDEAKALIAKLVSGPEPLSAATAMGPVVSRRQWMRIQGMITAAISAGAEVLAGGPGLPGDRTVGFHVRPTVLLAQSNSDVIAQEEVFGPVLTVLTYSGEDEAAAIANDTPYGLAAYVFGDNEKAQDFARLIRAGQIILNGAQTDMAAPFGGFKQSGNGREWGAHAFTDFVELKALVSRS